MKKKLLLFFIVIFVGFTIKAQLTQSFDAALFPPTGWNNTHTIGTDPTAVWERATAGTFGGDLDPNGNNSYNVDPHSGAGMATFRSYDFDPGNGAYLFSNAVNLTSGGPHNVSFWMYRDNVYTSQDSISVYINTSQSAVGASFLGKVLRKRSYAPVESGPDGWYQYTFNIPPSFNSASNYLIFSAVGRYGNNLFLDDIVVAPQPNCGVPTGIKTTNYNYGAGTATLNWVAPSLGTPVGYEWAINTSGVAPSSGTLAAGNSASITGIVTGSINYVYVRTNCGGSYSTWASEAFAALPCPALLTPANGATNTLQSLVFNWAAVAGADSYDFYFGTTSGNLVNLGNISAPSASISNVLPSTTYYWFTVPVIGVISAPAGGCSIGSFTTGPEPATPVNNPCSGAVSITATNTAANKITSTTFDATLSIPGTACGGFANSPDDDVWFEFTTTGVTPSGTLTISPTVASDSIIDIVAQVYAATSCAALGTPVTCADATSYGSEVIDLSVLSPNTHYYMRVFSFDSPVENQGDFTIEASAGNTLSGTTVPVSLGSFTARRSNGVNILNWSTQQELNTNHFVVERSTNGVNFVSIGQVTAAGNSSTVRNYIFTDLHPSRGNNYYRLRTVEKDNTSKLSDTRRIRNDGIADVSIFPNPVTSKLSVSINADKASQGQLSITDLSGKIVYTATVKLPQGNTILPVSMNNMASGTYLIKIQLNDDIIVKKFNKQ
ncbi:MAG: T9SS type A sorting domain-containing protein [Ferruginibacter sp.]